MKKVYKDENGCLVFVSSGISKGASWMTVRQNGQGSGTHRIKSKALPLRETEEEAQADLDRYAKKKGWEEVRT